MNEPPFYLVWREGGSSPVHQHKSATSAENEAERLAGLYPGSKFFVLVPSCLAVERRVTIERFDVLASDVPF